MGGGRWEGWVVLVVGALLAVFFVFVVISILASAVGGRPSTPAAHRRPRCAHLGGHLGGRPRTCVSRRPGTQYSSGLSMSTPRPGVRDLRWMAPMGRSPPWTPASIARDDARLLMLIYPCFLMTGVIHVWEVGVGGWEVGGGGVVDGHSTVESAY